MQIPEGLLGFRGDPKWRDMSDFLVHFTSRDALYSIVRDGHLEARKEFGWFRSDVPTRHLRMSACLSEIPVDQIDRLTARRGRYGIAFRRPFVQAAGGARVWYAEEPQRTTMFQTFGQIRPLDPDREHPAWRLTPFIDDVTAGYDFTWEREWRVPGGLRFTPGDVAFLIIPKTTGGSAIFENPLPDTPLLTAEGVEFWNEAFYALGGPEDKWVDEFLREFSDPINYLSWDNEEFDYVWTSRRWSTEDAVDWLFDDLDDDAVESLAARLNDMAPYWLKADEI